VATEELPEHPNLTHLRGQARDLQRGLRNGDPTTLKRAGRTEPIPDYSLARAQRAIARRFGFTSWARLKHHVEAINAKTWVPPEASEDEPVPDRFLRLACLNYASDDPVGWQAAAELRVANPDIATTALSVAAVCGDAAAVRRHLSADPGSAQRPAGPYEWSPLMYLAYSRLDTGTEAVLATARLLVDAGADPNDGRFFGGLSTPFTVLTGVFGGGEQHPPPHRAAIPLARLLLSRGAEANDGQTLYNRMFTVEDDFLGVLFEFGLGDGDGGPWRRLLPDLLQSPAESLRDLLAWAVTHDQRARVALLAEHGVDVLSPYDGGKTPIDLAVANGLREMRNVLQTFGAVPTPLSPVDAFISAALAGDAEEVFATSPEIVAAAREQRPALLVWAASQGRLSAIELLVANRFDLNAYGRGDVPVEQEWQTALHTAVEHGHGDVIRLLVALGADTSLRDKRFDATPLDWSDHFERPDLRRLLDGLDP
jgi:hypothetical protein